MGNLAVKSYDQEKKKKTLKFLNRKKRTTFPSVSSKEKAQCRLPFLFLSQQIKGILRKEKKKT